jgi:two-component system phosphate regulon sensor histidine kinase PhoR
MDTPPHGGWIRVEVRDTGAGIASAHLPRIFERFYRADAARSREEGGTGLGLAIVKHMVEGHGGTVQAESLLGAGTTIRFTLPAPDEADVAPDDASASTVSAESSAAD